MCGLLPTDTLGLFAGNIDTLACALLERVYYCKVDGVFVPPPPVNSELVYARLSTIRQQLAGYIPSFAPVTYDQFVDMYKGPKKLVYQRAVDSLAELSVNIRDAQANAFVKREKCNVSKAPRVIQPRSPRYGASLGRYIKPFEKVLFKALARLVGSSQVVSKGLNLDGVGNLIASKWGRFRHPAAIGLDATKFDMHCSVPILSWEHSVYNSIFKNRELKRLLSWQLVNRGVGYADDGKVKYVVNGRRLSGDMNTSCGNCLIMCSIVIAYMRTLNVKFDLINNGDDCVIFCESEDVAKIMAGMKQWFIEFGYRIVCEAPVYNLEQVEFCQMHPVSINGGYRMVRNPRTAVEKDSFCVTTLHQNQIFADWAAGVAEGGLAGCDGIPVMAAFYNFLGRNGTAKDVLRENSGMSRLQRGMTYTAAPITENTRYSFFQAFGVMPDAQVEMEEWFLSTSWSNEVIPYRFRGYLGL